MENHFDLHIYTNNTPGGNDKVSFLCENAVLKGLRAVAFTDRIDLDSPDRYDNKRRLRHAYFDAARARQVFFNSIMVLTGVELAQAICNPEGAAKILASQQYDIVLSCVTRFPGKEVFSLPYAMPAEEFYAFTEHYTSLLLDTVQNTDFDVLSCVLAPFREQKQDFSLFLLQMTPVLKELAAREKALELSTRDLLGSGGIRNAASELIRLFGQVGGKYVTVGTESYYYHDVGEGLELALATLKRNGFTQVTLFNQRLPYTFNI